MREMSRRAALCGLVICALPLAACDKLTGNAPLQPGEVAWLSRAGDPPEQCSRATVRPGSRYFRPDDTEIARMEAAVQKALARRRMDDGTLYFEDVDTTAPARASTAFPTRWDRSYIGIERNGRRYLYGDFGPMRAPDTAGRRSIGAWGDVACDGGPQFFGAEMALQSGRVRFVGFNGEK